MSAARYQACTCLGVICSTDTASTKLTNRFLIKDRAAGATRAPLAPRLPLCLEQALGNIGFDLCGKLIRNLLDLGGFYEPKFKLNFK